MNSPSSVAEPSPSPADRRSGAEPPAVVAEDLVKTYGSGAEAVRAVDGVSFAVEPGTVVGLLGPNGAGKTTLVKCLLGLVVPDRGDARIRGVDGEQEPRRAYAAVGAMLEGARNVYWRLTVRENLRFFARLAGRPADGERIDDLIDRVGLTEKADVTVNELSRGMKGRVSLACTLIRDTSVLFLDEPTLGLDVESSRRLQSELTRMATEEGRTVLVSSHDMDVVESVCDRVLIVNDGRIVADDSVENLLSLFRTGTYRITLDGDLPVETREELADRFEADGWTHTGDRLSFDVIVAGAAFYDLIDRLRATGRTVLDVESTEPDLEEVFLAVTEEESG